MLIALRLTTYITATTHLMQTPLLPPGPTPWTGRWDYQPHAQIHEAPHY